MQLGQVVTQARRLVQDTDTLEPRYGDDMLLGYANQALRRIAVARPDLFAVLDEVETKTGSAEVIPPADSIRIISVHAVVGGNTVVEIAKAKLDSTAPGWRVAMPAPAQNFARNLHNPNLAFISPPAPAGQKLLIEYAQTPPEYGVDEEVSLLPDAFRPVVVDYVVFLVESMSDESVASGRAALFLQSFNEALGIAAQSRVLTDTPRSGLNRKDVV